MSDKMDGCERYKVSKGAVSVLQIGSSFVSVRDKNEGVRTYSMLGVASQKGAKHIMGQLLRNGQRTQHPFSWGGGSHGPFESKLSGPL